MKLCLHCNVTGCVAMSLISSSKRPSQWHILQSLNSLLWIAQAGCIAWLIGRFQQTFAWQDILIAAGGVLIIGLIKNIIDNFCARQLYLQARRVLSQLRTDTIAALSRQSPLDSERPASGYMASVISEQAENIVPWFVRYQSAQSKVSIVPLCILIAVGFYSWTAALILIVAAPLIPFFMVIVGWSAQSASEKQMIELGQMNGYLLDRLRGLSTLRAFHAVSTTVKQLKAANKALKEKTMKVLRIAFLSSAVLELFSALGVALVAVYVGFHLLGELPFGAWGQKLSLAQGLFILLLAPAFFEPLRELSAAWHDRANGLAALDHIEQLQSSIHTTAVIPAATATDITTRPAATASEIVMHNVYFHIPQRSVHIQQFNLHVKPGEHIALTGDSGAGKSLLLSLIAGMIQPDQGTITIDGYPVDSSHIEHIRQQIAWLGQDPHIFTGQYQHNIQLYRDELPSSSWLTAIQLHEVLDRLPHRTLGEGGIGLSGGETLRLALARCMINQQASLILMDEPTAHLDQSTAKEIITVIRQFAKHKTCIIATHDPLLIAAMDRTVHIHMQTQEIAA